MTDKQTPERLHSALLTDLIARIETGELVLDAKTGETTKIPAPPAVLSAAINFLKQFPPQDTNMPEADTLSKTLKKYGEKVPVQFGGHA